MRVSLFPVYLLKAVFVAALLWAWPAQAHDEHDPRHQAMETLSDAMKALVQMQRGGFEADEAEPIVAAVTDVAERMPALFENRNPGENNNRAKPEIWDDWPGFTARIEQFRGAVAGLARAAESGDSATLGPALNAVGQACAACHRPYRAPES